jgi:glycogen(starch) synthase
MSFAELQSFMSNGPRVTSGPWRVLLVPSAYYPHVGGIEELTRQLALALITRGHHVGVLTNRWPAGVQPSETLDGIEVRRLRFPLPAFNAFAAARFLASSPTAVLALLRYVRRWRPTVIHVIGAGPPSVYLATFHGVLRARLLFTAQGELTFDPHGVFQHSATLRAGLRLVLREAHAVTACSAFVMRDIEGIETIRSPSYVIPNGVEPSEFVDASSEEDLGSYILGVGRLVPQKGFDLLVDALAFGVLSDLNLVLAGDGFERTRLEGRAAELGLRSRVRFLGSVDRSRLARLLRGARVFAFPSRGEPFGIALLEAMAAGVPAVATAAGGVPEFARDGENALLVQPESAEALATAIARVAADEPLRNRISVGGRKTAAELTWSRIAARYEAVYLSILTDSIE